MACLTGIEGGSPMGRGCVQASTLLAGVPRPLLPGTDDCDMRSLLLRPYPRLLIVPSAVYRPTEAPSPASA